MTLAEAAIQVASSYLGVRETGGPNRGPDVERFLAYVGCPPGESWCAAFVSYCIREAFLKAELDFVGPPQFKPSAGALHLLDINSGLRISQPVPGSIFIIDHRGGRGHTGFVSVTNSGLNLVTIEGNTGPGPAAPDKDRNGDGVYKRTDRKLTDCVGFLAIG